jgi:hypothetical protein
MKSNRPKLNLTNTTNAIGKRRKASKKKRIPYSKIGSQVLGDINSIRKMFNTELKYMDTTASATVGTTGTNTLINGLVQGTTSTTREGDTVKISRIQVNFTCSINPSSTVGYVDFRYFLVRDLQPNGVGFTNAQYLNSPNNVLSCINMPYSKRFITMDDQIFTLDANGPQAYTYRKVYERELHVEYGLGNAGTVADIAKESIYLIVLSNDNTNQPAYSFFVRIQFIDN